MQICFVQKILINSYFNILWSYSNNNYNNNNNNYIYGEKSVQNLLKDVK